MATLIRFSSVSRKSLYTCGYINQIFNGWLHATTILPRGHKMSLHENSNSKSSHWKLQPSLNSNHVHLPLALPLNVSDFQKTCYELKFAWNDILEDLSLSFSCKRDTRYTTYIFLPVWTRKAKKWRNLRCASRTWMWLLESSGVSALTKLLRDNLQFVFPGNQSDLQGYVALN